ncbi:MAG: hypothetical protein ABIG95_01240 [Candidatus Woesearchaeota archaeon]
MAIRNFVDVFTRLENMGLTDVLLPFLLIFAIIFAVFDRVKIFGEKRRNISVIVALVISLLVVIPHVTGGYPPGQDAVEIINKSIPNVSIIVVAIVMLLVMIGVFGADVNIAGKSIGGIIAFAAFLIIILIFGKSAGWFKYGIPPWLSFLQDPDTQALLVVLLIFGLIIWFVTGEEGKGSTGEGFAKMFESLGKAVERK